MADTYSSEAISNRLKLYQRLSSMTEDERGMFFKTVLYNETVNLLNAIKNMKGTSAETWRTIIRRFKSLQDMGFGFDGFDVSKFCGDLLPDIGAAAGLFLAMKEAGEKESESSDAANYTEDGNANLMDMNDAMAKEQVAKSRILQYCKDNINGFSL